MSACLEVLERDPATGEPTVGRVADHLWVLDNVEYVETFTGGRAGTVERWYCSRCRLVEERMVEATEPTPPEPVEEPAEDVGRHYVRNDYYVGQLWVEVDRGYFTRGAVSIHWEPYDGGRVRIDLDRPEADVLASILMGTRPKEEA